MQSIRRALKRAGVSIDDIPSTLSEATNLSTDQSALHKRLKGNTSIDSVSQPVDRADENADKYSKMFEAVLSNGNSNSTVDVTLSPGPTAKLDPADCTSDCCRHDQLIINMLHCQNQLISSINDKIDSVMSFLQVHNNYIPLVGHHQPTTIPTSGTSAPRHSTVQPTQLSEIQARGSTRASSNREQRDKTIHKQNLGSYVDNNNNHNNNHSHGNNNHSRFFQHSTQSAAHPADILSMSGDAHTTMIIHRTLKDVSRRRCNVIVSGLHEEKSLEDDRNAFLNICEQWLPIKPDLPSGCCMRIGKQLQSGVPRRLLIHTGSEETADAILKGARLLRRSDDIEVSERIFINPDLAPEAAKLAYEQRQRRRTTRQQNTVSADSRVSLDINNFLDTDTDILPTVPSPLTPPTVDTSNSRLVYAPAFISASTAPSLPTNSAEFQSSSFVTMAEIHRPPPTACNVLDEISPVEVNVNDTDDQSQ